MYKIKFLIIIFFSILNSYSQKKNEFNFLKEKFFQLQNNPDSALIYVNKIIKLSKPNELAFGFVTKKYILTLKDSSYNEEDYNFHINENLKKIKPNHKTYDELSIIYNIIGHIEKNKNRLNNSLKHYLQAKDYAQKTNNLKQLAKIKISLALNLNELNQFDKAIKECKDVNEIIKKLDLNNFDYNLLQNTNINTLGTIYFKKYEFNPKINIKYSDSAIIEFSKIYKNTKDEIFLAQASYSLGSLFLIKKQFDNANYHYLKCIDIYTKLEFTDRVNRAKFNYYLNNFEKGDYKIAKKGFLEILKNKNKEIDFKFLLSHKYLAKIYYSEKKIDSTEYYYNKYISLYEKSSDKEKNEFAEAYKNIENNDLKEEIKKIKNENSVLKFDKKILIVLILILFILSVLIFKELNKRKKKKEESLIELIEKYKTKSVTEIEVERPITIKNEIELQIIENLEKLEQKKFFLHKDFSLYTLSKKTNTNTTYLSNIINNHKKMNFNDYTNSLRIDYIINEFIVNKTIRNYTNQALAEMVGYKNGASFSRIFKDKTGVTPVVFIKKLNEN
jgi:AraC-like DNA-binding protein